MAVVKVEKYIIFSIPGSQIGRVVILVKMYVETFKTDVIDRTSCETGDYVCWELQNRQGLSWLWSYGIWIYNYLCNQCLSPLTLWVRTQLRRGVLDATIYDEVCLWLTTGQWFSPVSSTNKTDHHDIKWG
jgi:hypothetical protein